MSDQQIRVPIKAGQLWVVVNDELGEVDGPHKQRLDGYKIAKPGRRSVHVFADAKAAMDFAEAAVARLVEAEDDAFAG